jgi:hypothetical protein
MRDEAEKDIPETPNVPINYFYLKNGSDPAAKLLGLGIAYKIREDDRGELLQDLENFYSKRKKLSGGFMAKVSSLVKKYEEENPIPDSFGADFTRGAFPIPLKFSKDMGYVNFHEIPEQLFPNVEIPRLLREFIEDELIFSYDFGKLSVGPKEFIEAFIVHEYTHAYIHSKRKGFTGIKVRSDGRIFDSFNVNEAAAQAITSIYVPSFEMDVEGYLESEYHDFSRAFLQFFKACFMSYATRFNGNPKKAYRIRKRAVKSINRFQANRYINISDILTRGKITELTSVQKFSLTEAILEEKDHELLKFAEVVYCLEEAEKHSFHALVLLNILPPERAKKYVYELDNELESTFEHSMTRLFPEEGFIQDSNGLGLLYETGKSLAGGNTESSIRYEKTEFKDSLNKVRRGIR